MALKSAAELAMERMGASSDKPLTQQQKDAIADINQRMEARLAEVDIMSKTQLLKAQGDPLGMQAVHDQRITDIRRIKEEAEADKRAVRGKTANK